jgi:hypothetical protein
LRDRFHLLIFVLHLYRCFFEFPSGIRHLCTTMPWTIWPALVVLWGVCWMFIVDWSDGGSWMWQPDGLFGGMHP